MQAGKRRGYRPRRVSLLSSGASVQISPPDWVKFADGSFVKDFDAKQTSILRVWRHKTGDGAMVYGMRAENGKTVSEAYEIVPIQSMAIAALDAVAAHCGLSDLRKRVSLA